MKDSKDLIVVSMNICALAVCVPNDWNEWEINSAANARCPTQISSNWTLSEEQSIKLDQVKIACKEYPDTRTHYALYC